MIILLNAYTNLLTAGLYAVEVRFWICYLS